MHPFQLHPRLQEDSLLVGNFSLCQVLLMNDSQYPWYILVPRRSDMSEIYQLTPADRQLLLAESCLLAVTMHEIYRPDKLNIAAIGNLVPQLHIHHVARYKTDVTWPSPVWGKLPTQPYPLKQAENRINQIREYLIGHLLD